eukprot:CAMPEP_0194255764 /NCGR_PEP_ID=MMETSP0158-20130606/35262_1 /TAXON_ID=33649 /ORGANISM="Thalassionema nitzschioides, Strain L26-B" /LENGTH=69 /DNA_ID=CAMNT_0038994231 /DNA_START=15 /DNA_END=224 /DNA_ORIENTATION=+
MNRNMIPRIASSVALNPKCYRGTRMSLTAYAPEAWYFISSAPLMMYLVYGRSISTQIFSNNTMPELAFS